VTPWKFCASDDDGPRRQLQIRAPAEQQEVSDMEVLDADGRGAKELWGVVRSEEERLSDAEKGSVHGTRRYSRHQC
jgi:hypothetical protein